MAQLQTLASRTAAPPACFAQPRSAPALSSIVYRSRAVHPFSGHELLHLTRAAQARNQAEAITGLVLHDEGRFYQWLEGPQDSLSRVMQSIQNDGRHTDMEVLSRRKMRRRTFSGWNLKLAVQGSFAAADVMQPPAQVLEDLRRRPGQVATALARLARSGASLPVGSAARLEDLIRSRVLVEVAARHGIAGARAHPSTPELARLLLGDAMAPVEELVGGAAVQAGSLLSLRTPLFEPAARILGDMWLEDTCTDTAVMLGLWLLQSAVRRLTIFGPLSAARTSPGRVLVAPVPGELHLLGTALASDALHEAGWNVTVAFPADADSLVKQLWSGCFDALHLSLSDAFRREDSLPLLARTIRMARSGSGNPPLKVTVGGRIFADGRVPPSRFGADALLPAGRSCPAPEVRHPSPRTSGISRSTKLKS